MVRLIALFAALIAWLWFAEPEPVDLWIGLPFVVAGTALRLWAAGHLEKTTRLITSGPYAYTRNPMYLGRLLIFVGLAFAARLPNGWHWILMALGLAIFFFYYMPRKERVEGARLLDVHGEAYGRYRTGVPPLFPRTSRWTNAERRAWCTGSLIENRELWMTLGVL
ncbi:MAG: isoprenylcysteine carboxylmethyltransferase family protein, partial [Planctomycetota bacterium]|nr:isoprenylcysteine carboxylmethyltransferase family protein [Planctomycetota bacterium]